MEKGDCSHLLDIRPPSQFLKKALVLLEHQVTKEDVRRQLKVVNQYILVSKSGFLVPDLGNIMYLSELLRNRMIEEPKFEDLLIKLLDLCHIPPRITKASEQLIFSADIKEFFSWLGYMVVWATKQDTQIQILKAIYSLLTEDYASKKYYLPLAVRKERAWSSILSELLGELLEIVEDEIYSHVLKVVEIFIEGSKQTCLTLLKKGAVSSLIVRMEPTWRDRLLSIKPQMPTGSEEILDSQIIFHILTLLLEHANTKTMKAPTKYTLWSLQWAFRLFCLKETTPVERNNVLAILLLLMDIYPDLLSGNLTFSYDISMLAMTRDIVFHQNWTTDIMLTTSNEDHCCMALLLMCISYFPNCLSGPKAIEECRVVMGLLKLIGHQQSIKWQQLQACFLIRLALNILPKIIPASTEEFIEDGGPMVIIQLLNRARECRNCYNFDIVYRSLELLSIMSFKFQSVRDSVAYNGGVTCILPLLEMYLNAPYLSIQNQLISGASMALVEQIITHDEVPLVLPMLLSYMKRYINPNKEDPVQLPRLIIVVLGFIWNRIACSARHSKEFVDKGGIYLLLDIIQISCIPVKMVGLGALIDICEIVECIPYLITWRRKGKRIRSLLADIFRQENKELLVKIDNHGIILDPRYPIMGRTQRYETFCSCTRVTGNPSIADMFVSCRPKIYCLLQILNTKQSETVEIVDEFYKLYDEELSAEDEITLLLAENFLALKLAEEWLELDKEFSKMGLEPIPFDNAIVRGMIEITNHWGTVLQRMQQEVLRKHQMKEWRDEQTVYKKIRNASLSDAWDAICQMKYIARCSERLFRISSTFNLQSQINHSLYINQVDGHALHRTLPNNISVSCLHDQNIDVLTAISEKSMSHFLPVFVSPIGSNVSLSITGQDEEETEYISEDTFLSRQILTHELELDYSPRPKSTCKLIKRRNSSDIW